MVNDPYKTLEIERGATAEEIKSAYRKMAKKYHPDLHPDDPNAALKMNDINEAYDMLTHPEKYEKKRAEEQARQSYSGYGHSNGSSYGGQNSYGYGSGSSGNSGYRGAGGWYSDFGGFEDFFNFGAFGQNYQSVNLNPEHENTDSRAKYDAVNFINSGRYAEATAVLMQEQSSGRNARWYYLYSVALYGNGDSGQAVDYIYRAVQMEPSNTKYRMILNKFKQEGQTYYREETSIVNPFRHIGRFILIIIIINFIIRLLFMMGGGFMYPGF